MKKILITGSSESAYYDETGTMRRWLLERGLPEAALIQDDLGLRTSTHGPRRGFFEVRDAVVCTQSFHQPRALWAKRAGIDAVGLDAAQGARPPPSMTLLESSWPESVPSQTRTSWAQSPAP